jgi:hypothetical protein
VRLFGLLLLAAIGGCTASHEAIDNSLSIAADCMRQKAAELDDHISSATSIAYGLTAACGTEIHNTTDLVTNGLMLETVPRVTAQVNETMLKVATAIVLQERNGTSR